MLAMCAARRIPSGPFGLSVRVGRMGTRAAAQGVVPPRRVKLRKPAEAEDIADAELRKALGETARCEWAQRNPALTIYHDDVWGERPADDREIFERLMFEIFHAGLSWTLIWNKREGLRSGYAGFDIAKVAGFGPADVERLMNDPDVVRSARKIDATIANARTVLQLQVSHGSLEAWMLALPPAEDAKLKVLKQTFKFMGPGVGRSFVESAGLVPPPHHPFCFKAGRPLWSATR